MGTSLACKFWVRSRKLPGVLVGNSIEGAIVTSVCYMDIYSCAARASEIHRFLVGYKASREEVNEALQRAQLRDVVEHRDGFYFLKGKDHLWARRIRFLEHSRRAWVRAREIASKVEASGLASAGLVTGSLAAENCDEHADIDFLFIYPAQRTWISFGLMRLLGKVPRLGLGNMCPNYALPDDHLEIQPQNLFTAWEIAKAVPMFGNDVYQAFVEANAWVREYLPNALPSLDRPIRSATQTTDHSLIKRAMASPAFQWFEQREKRRKWKRDKQDVGIDIEKRYAKGSVDRHAPTRPFQALCELRYRMDLFGLEQHPLYAKIHEASNLLGTEMNQWGEKELKSDSTTSVTVASEQQSPKHKQEEEIAVRHGTTSATTTSL
jgi:hypothetical protein